MRKLVLLLIFVLFCTTLFSQEAKGKRTSCVDGIPLECLNTGDTLKGKNVNYEVRKSDNILFLRNVHNKYDTSRAKGLVLGENMREANTCFDSLKNNILKIVYDHLTPEEIAEVIHEDANLCVYSVVDSSLRVREIVFGLPKNFCDYDENDRLKFDSIYLRLLNLGYYDKKALDAWEKMYLKRTFNSVGSKARFWRTFPVDRFYEIEKKIIAKAKLNDDDIDYKHVMKHGIWKRSYFMVVVYARFLDKMRENEGKVPSWSVFYDVYLE